MKIRFVRKFRPAGDAPDIPTYKAGEVYDLALDYAKKYIARGYAVEYVEPQAEPVVEVAVEAEPVDEWPKGVIDPDNPPPPDRDHDLGAFKRRGRPPKAS